MNGPSIKLAQLGSKISLNNTNDVEDIPLEFFSDIELKQSVDCAVPKDKLYYAKDKSAYRPGNPLGANNTINEIEETITFSGDMRDTRFPKITGSDDDPTVHSYKQSDFFPTSEYVVKLKEKEREQSEFLRLFGIGSIPLKVGLSIATEQTKKVLSYIKGNLMSVTDKERNQMLFDLAQDVTRKNIWSFLADVEGHNQSMQIDNTSELALEVSRVTGLKDLKDLPKVFRSLACFYSMEYFDEVILIKNQHGGIEGWQNPFWTIVTCCLIDSMRDESPVKLVNALIYSDDINAAIELNEYNEELINEFFSFAIGHTMKMGFILKPSQTSLSKNRVTMLRRHYTNGQRADSSIKKLLAVSSMNEPAFLDESIEVSSICSSTNSAMEQANHPYPAVFMKHYHIISLCFRSFTNQFISLKADTWLVQIEYTQLTKAVISRNIHRWLSANDSKLEQETYKFYNTLLVNYDMRKQNDVSDIIKNFIKDISNTVISIFDKTYESYLLLRCMDTDINLFSTYLAFVFTPESWGGLGTIPALYQMISGHSVSITRSVDYLNNLLILIKCPHLIRSKLMDNIYGAETDISTENFKLSTLNSYYPPCKGLTLAKELIRSKIINYMKNLKLNDYFKELLETENKKEVIKQQYYDIMKDKLHCRISSLFIEASPIAILDSLISKVETSRGFFRRSGKMKEFCQKVFRLNRIRYLKFFKRKDKLAVSFSSYESVTEFFEARNNFCFKEVTFINMPEPVFESIINWQKKGKILSIATSCEDLDNSRGFSHRRFPDIKTNSLYKGEKAEKYIRFEDVISRIIYDLSNAVLWILEVSGYGLDKQGALIKTSVYKAYAYTLSLYGVKDPIKILSKAITGVGGNVAHRLKANIFKSTVDLHVYPNVLGSVSCCILPQTVSEMNIEDSNFNFDLIAKRNKLAYVVRTKECHEEISTLTASLESYIDAKDVRIDWCFLQDQTGPMSDIQILNYKMPHLDLVRMEVLSRRSGVDITARTSTMIRSAELNNLAGNYPKIIEDLEILRYREMLISNNIILLNDVGNLDNWMPFINRDKNNTFLQAAKDYDKEMERIKGVCKRHKSLASLFTGGNISIDLSQRISDALYASLKTIDETLEPIENMLFGSPDLKILLCSLESNINESGSIVLETEGIKRNVKDYKTAIMIILLYKLFPSFTTDGTNINGDPNKAYEQVNVCYSSDFNVKSLKSPYVRTHFILIQLFRKDELISHVVDAMNKLLSRASNISYGLIVGLTEPRYSKFEVNLDDTNIIPFKDFSYKLRELKSFDPSIMVKFKSLARKSNMISKVYADVQSTMSYTGSDSYLAQFGLFKNLISEKIIQQSDTVIELCPGRGDGNVAMSQLGLEVTSIARKTLFTSSYVNSKIILRSDYDLFQVEFVAMTTNFNVVHIDLSYIKGNQKALETLIPQFLIKSRIVTLRINSLSIDSLIAIIEKLKNNCKIYVSYPPLGRLLPYQIYIIFEKRIDQEGRVKFINLLAVSRSSLSTLKRIDNEPMIDPESTL